MKKRNYLVTLFIGCALALTNTSCNDDDSKPTTLKPGPTDAVNPLFEENRDDLKQQFTLNISTGGDVKGEQGTKVRFYPNSLTKLNGDAVTGEVSVELIEIYRKSDMLLTKMPTRGLNEEGDIALLISGGEFYVNATQNGEQLKVASTFVILAPTEMTGGDDTDMKVFRGAEECDNDGCEVIWEKQDRDMNIGKEQDGTAVGGVQSVYQVFQSQFGWTNIDRWYSDPRPKTTIFVDVPEGYDNTNCAVYLSYDGETSALALFDTYNSTTELFTEHYGLIPIGLQAHFIMVSVIEGQWYYAIRPATITANHVETFTTLQPVTEAQLTTLIDALP
jgi:hypothetical protein